MAGRKPITIHNPFIRDGINELWDVDHIDVRLDDIIVGCVRTHGDTISSGKLIRLYRNVDEFTTTKVQAYLEGSTRQAQTYMAMVKFCNPFIERHYTKPATNVYGYIEVTAEQCRAGYLKYSTGAYIDNDNYSTHYDFVNPRK